MPCLGAERGVVDFEERERSRKQLTWPKFRKARDVAVSTAAF
jgi:hypothetical protein